MKWWLSQECVACFACVPQRPVLCAALRLAFCLFIYRRLCITPDWKYAVIKLVRSWWSDEWSGCAVQWQDNWLTCGSSSCFMYRVESPKGCPLKVKLCDKLRHIYPVRCLWKCEVHPVEHFAPQHIYHKFILEIINIILWGSLEVRNVCCSDFIMKCRIWKYCSSDL